MHLNLFDGIRRAAGGAVLLATLALVSACSSSDKRPLLLFNVNAFPGAATVEAVVSVGGAQVADEFISVNPTGKYGVYLPSGTSGKVDLSVLVYDGASCFLASGSPAPVTVSPGEKSGPVTVPLTASPDSCLRDGGVPDTLVAPPGDVGGLPDVTVVEVAMGPDLAPIVPADAPAAEAQAPDVLLRDLPATLDVPADEPTPDALVTADVAPDGAAERPFVMTEVGATTLGVLHTCTPYTHSETFSDGTIGDWAVLKLVFSPDGKYLTSFGEDGRAKVWQVTTTGLAPVAGDLIFSGQYELSGAVSPDGKYLAIGERYGQVAIYDFPASIAAGGAVLKWTLPATAFSPTPWRAARLQFTTDGNHLVVAYSGESSPDPNLLVVWDLTTQTIVRTITYVYEDWPRAVLPASYTDPMWVASAATISGDAGDETIVTLVDVAQTSPIKAQAAIPGTVDSMAFSPGGNALAIGLDTGEVSLWDVTDKTKLVRPAAPIVAATTAFYSYVYALTFTSDGNYLAMAADGASSSFVKLISQADKVSVQKNTTYSPVSLAFAPGNLGLAVGELDMGTILYCTPQ